MKKLFYILLNAVPIAVMVALIPYILNDYLLAAIYLIIILISLKIAYTQHDLLVLVFGFVAMFISEYFFIKTGVETFHRRSLLGIMPIWLPILWAYGFVAIKHSTEILSRNDAPRTYKKSARRRR